MKQIKVIPTNKFKDVLVSLRYANNDRSQATVRTLLSLMLVDRSEKYNSKVLMNELLDNMFGASLMSRTFSYGYYHVIDITMSVLNSNIVGVDLFDKQLTTLSELVYHPLLNDDVFAEAKQVLADLLVRKQESLESEAIHQALNIAGSDYPLAYRELGSLAELEKLKLDDVKQALSSMISNDDLTVIVLGDVDVSATETMINNLFADNNSDSYAAPYYLVDSEEVKKKTMDKQIDQSYLALVYNTYVSTNEDQYWALQIGTMILGQLPSSFLFQEVREKRSLSYTISANVLGYDGVLYISGGVRVDAVEEASEISKLQVERLKAGEFTVQQFEAAKTMLINSMRTTDDDNYLMVIGEYRNILINTKRNTADLICLIEQIEIKDVINSVSKLKLNSEYQIVGGKLNAENN